MPSCSTAREQRGGRGGRAGPAGERSPSLWPPLPCPVPHLPWINRDPSHRGPGKGRGAGVRSQPLWPAEGTRTHPHRGARAVPGRRGARPSPARPVPYVRRLPQAVEAGGEAEEGDEGQGGRAGGGGRGGTRRRPRPPAGLPLPRRHPRAPAARCSAPGAAHAGPECGGARGTPGDAVPAMRGRQPPSPERRPGRRWAPPPPRYAALAPRSPRGREGSGGRWRRHGRWERGLGRPLSAFGLRGPRSVRPRRWLWLVAPREGRDGGSREERAPAALACTRVSVAVESKEFNPVLNKMLRCAGAFSRAPYLEYFIGVYCSHQFLLKRYLEFRSKSVLSAFHLNPAEYKLCLSGAEVSPTAAPKQQCICAGRWAWWVSGKVRDLVCPSASHISPGKRWYAE